jgi:GNAT superfamily N-acetyltransferase
MPLVAAQGDLLERILDDTYSLWNEGLSRRAYGQLNAAQVRTPWGASHLQRVALVDESGALLSSAKRYRFDARLGGRRVQVCGIGAVFTPSERRGRGHATTLIQHIVEQERQAGADAALLFSEIGADFYHRLGFSPVPLDEVTVRVKQKGGAPAVLVRAGHESDLPALAAMHVVRAAQAQFALEREPPLLQFLLTKKRLYAGLGPEGARQLEFFVVEEGATAVAYVILSITPHGWTLDEAGDRDPAGARLGALLQTLLAREPSHEPPLILAWWPRTFPGPPQLQLTNYNAARDVMMMRALSGVELPTVPGAAFYWRSDVF